MLLESNKMLALNIVEGNSLSLINLFLHTFAQKPALIELVQEAIDYFKSRRSIRKFSTTEVDFKIIHSIVEAGINAPCAGNILNWKLIKTTPTANKKVYTTPIKASLLTLIFKLK